MKTSKVSKRGTIAWMVSGFLLFTSLPVLAAVPGDEHWDSQFGPVGTGDPLWAVTAFGGKVYAGGIFTAAGNVTANYVAGYDGTNWFPLNNGVSNSLNTTYVFALANDGTNLYAGGWFTNADNSGAHYLARWDGSNWWPLAGANPNSIVETIRIYGTNIFVGGYFTTNGLLQVNGIMRWNGSSWQAVGSGVTGAGITAVLATEYDGTNLYVGGSFTQAGGLSATNIARWDGASWTALGNSLPGTVSALARYGGYLYAGGNFTNASLGITNLARWDGATWSASGISPNGPVRDLLSNSVNLYVGGDFTQIGGVAANRIAKWNGVAWSPLGTGVQAFGAGASPGVYKMAFNAQGQLFAAGNFNQAGSVGASHVGGWDGTNWFALGGTTSKGLTHFLGQALSLLADGTNLYAGGIFTEAGSVIVNGVARWNGTNWSSLGSAAPGMLPASSSTQVRAFARVGSILFAGGSFTNIGGVTAKAIAQWDGTNWSGAGDADAAVRALARDSSGYLYAGGSFTNIGGILSPALAVLVGTSWANLGSLGGASPVVNAIAVDGLDIYVGGSFTNIGGFAVTNLARWSWSDGLWHTLGSGVNGAVNALVASNGVVYAGGSFTSAGGTTVNHIARWNGTSWAALGGGVTGSSFPTTVSAIAYSGASLYITGNFTNAGGVYAPGVAEWDGANWSALGSGLYLSLGSGGPGAGNTLAVMGNDLFVGGKFTSAGGKPAMFIARWDNQLNFYPPPHLQLTRQTWLFPGQFQFRVAGTSGESYIIQSSTNLNAWTPLLTNSATLYDFTDTSALNYPYQFYRAVLGP